MKNNSGLGRWKKRMISKIRSAALILLGFRCSICQEKKMPGGMMIQPHGNDCRLCLDCGRDPANDSWMSRNGFVPR